jgi:transcriptional regulator with XRE-family HTH domain
MNKRTEDDDAFIALFAPALKREYRKAKKKGITDQVFAESIGVERPSLDRYLDGESMPSVRTVAFAHREYKISIPYNRISLQSALPTNGKKKKPEALPQMVLPFTVEMEKAGTHVDVKLDSVSVSKFAFRVIVDQTG